MGVVEPVQVNENDNLSPSTEKALQELIEKEKPRSRPEVTTSSQLITEASKQETESQKENEAATTVSPLTIGESQSPHSVETTSPSSYDLLVNLMDHFNLNAIINSLQEDTLD